MRLVSVIAIARWRHGMEMLPHYSPFVSESINQWWIHLAKGHYYDSMVSLVLARTSGWANIGIDGNLKRHDVNAASL